MFEMKRRVTRLGLDTGERAVISKYAALLSSDPHKAFRKIRPEVREALRYSPKSVSERARKRANALALYTRKQNPVTASGVKTQTGIPGPTVCHLLKRIVDRLRSDLDGHKLDSGGGKLERECIAIIIEVVCRTRGWKRAEYRTKKAG